MAYMFISYCKIIDYETDTYYKSFKNPLDLIELSRKGLSRAAVDLVAQKLSLSDRDMA